MQDWLGNEYGPGDLVVYAALSGRSITMVLGRVVDVYKVYRDPDKYEWARLAEGEEPPFHRKWNHDTKSYDRTDERIESELRVKILPLKSSRWQQHGGNKHYEDSRTGKTIDVYRSNDKHVVKWGYNIDTRTGDVINDRDYNKPVVPYEFRKYIPTVFKDYVVEVATPVKPVIIQITENVMKWTEQNDTLLDTG
jgi:hypothetical protein